MGERAERNKLRKSTICTASPNGARATPHASSASSWGIVSCVLWLAARLDGAELINPTGLDHHDLAAIAQGPLRLLGRASTPWNDLARGERGLVAVLGVDGGAPQAATQARLAPMPRPIALRGRGAHHRHPCRPA